MDKILIEKYQKYIKAEWKTAFLSAFFTGLLVHIYKFTNTLPNHDSLLFFYDPQNNVASGRWFLSVACGISSFFDLPWVEGILSLAFAGMAAAVIADVLEIRDKVFIFLASAILVSVPSLTGLFYYEYTADGYMLSMLLAVLAVRLSDFERKKPVHFIAPIALLCLSCGIYQAYVSFALLLTAFYFIGQQLEGKRTVKESLLYIAKQLLIYALALALYYVIWKLCMRIGGVAPSDYKGIDDVSNLSSFRPSVAWLVTALRSSFVTFILHFTEMNIFEHGLTLYAALNIVFFVLFIAGLIFAAVKTETHKKPWAVVLILAALGLTVPISGMWFFASDKVEYHEFMLHGLCLYYAFGGILFEKYVKPRLSAVFALLIAVIVFNNAVMANVGYYYLDKCYERSYATALQMTMRIRELEEEESFDKIAVVGHVRNELGTEGESMKYHIVTMKLKEDLMHRVGTVEPFLTTYFGIDYEFYDEEEVEMLAEKPEIKELEMWPSRKSVAVIDGICIIKMNNTQEEEE